MPKVLVIEDDQSLCRIIVDALTFQHVDVEAVHDGANALELLNAYVYDLVLLDWDLPSMSGIRILENIRSNGVSTPVLMMTGHTSIDEKEMGLDTGADDYLSKPFLIRELTARVRALLRRPAATTGNVLKVGNLSLDPVKFRFCINGRPVDLTKREFSLLEFFMRHPGECFNAETLIERVWLSEEDATINGLRACIARLRTKIDAPEAQSLIQNIPGIGYKLNA